MSNQKEVYTLRQPTREHPVDSLEAMKEDWWQNRYREWSDSGAYFSSSTKPLERRKFQAWVKRVGKEAKDKDNKSLMMLAYNVIKDYEIYPDPVVDTINEF